MRNVTIKGLLAHKLRLLLTALAIILGVTFISGTFVLTDTLHSTFSGLFGNIYSKIDFQVRGVAQFGTNSANAVRDPIPESLLAKVQAVPGVETADGTVEGYAQFVAPDGKAIETGGAPTLGINYNDDPQISVLRIIAGGPPVHGQRRPHGRRDGAEVRLHGGPAASASCSPVRRAPSPSPASPSSGAASNLAGATLAGFTLPTAQDVLQEPGVLDAINVVTTPGADQPAVQRDIANESSRRGCRWSPVRRLSKRTRTPSIRRCRSSTRRC